MDFYRNCTLCPNHCKVDRTLGRMGRCHESDKVRIAWSGLHKGEEPPVSGELGSGMIFFSGCPLHCAYCQNCQISNALGSLGLEISIEELAKLMLRLQEMGAYTINMVTGTHFIPSIIEAIKLARSLGLKLDIVWNSSGFEDVSALEVLDPYIDLYLVDMKTLDRKVGKTFCGLARYADDIVPVMEFLKEKHPRTSVGDDGRLKGLLVRHLVFPTALDASLDVLAYYAKNLKANAYLSVMVQFEPPAGSTVFPPITEKEYDTLVDQLEKLEIEDGFIQELGENVSWLPDFNRDNPFPESFASPLPYFLELKCSRGLQ